jgi:hypothetical protein
VVKVLWHHDGFVLLIRGQEHYYFIDAGFVNSHDQ